MASEPQLVTIDPNGDTVIILENPQTCLLDPTLGQQLEVNENTDSDIDSNSDKSIAHSATEDASHDSAANESSSRPAVKFLVSSRQLRIVSSYFDSLFKGGYNETVPNPDDGLYHIKADRWDTEAMEVIMNIVHVQVKRIPESVSLELFVKILILVDYYHMQDAIASHAKLWMAQIVRSDRPTVYSAKAVYWLFLAIRMEDRTLSRNMARVIITTAVRPITFQGLPFPPELEDRLNTVRREALQALRVRVRTLKKDLLEGRDGCHPACQAMLLGSLLQGLRGLNLHRYINGVARDVVLQNVWGGLNSIYTPDWCGTARPREPHLCDVRLRLGVFVTDSIQVVNYRLQALSL